MLPPTDPRRPPAGPTPGRPRRRRRHAMPHVDDRALLEAAGWRTTLEYRENHRRTPDGVLCAVEARWRGDAERSGPADDVIVFSATGPTPAAVWRRLRLEAEATEATATAVASARR